MAAGGFRRGAEVEDTGRAEEAGADEAGMEWLVAKPRHLDFEPVSVSPLGTDGGWLRRGGSMK